MIIELVLSIEDIDAETTEFILKSDGELDDDVVTWKKEANCAPSGPDYDLTVTTSKPNGIKIIKGNKISSSETEIKEMFNLSLLESSFRRKSDEADGIEHEHEATSAQSIQIEKEPYDPKLIRVDTKPFSIRHIYEMLHNGDIDLSPDFQREFVWLDITRKSRLIESLLLRIPLPVFYLAQDEEGKFKVVDGVQRLTVIRDFMDNKFKLKNLEYLNDCEGKWYQNKNREPSENLKQLYVRRIEQSQLYMNVIDPQTPEKVKYDIFRRINTGGKSLNAQEIRNCLAHPKTRQFLQSLAASETFLTATRHSISSTRMADKEIVLRFIAFYLLDHNLYSQKEYKGDMDGYLDHTVDILNKRIENELLEIEVAFETAMENAYLLFEDRAFRKANFINKSLFLSWSRVLCDIPTSKLLAFPMMGKVAGLLAKEIQEDVKYNDVLSMATNDARNVGFSYEKAREILKGCSLNG